MNQVTFSADKENLLFIFGDQLIKYPLRDGVLVSFVEGQPVVAKVTPKSIKENSPKFEMTVNDNNQVCELIIDHKQNKGYLVGELEIVIGFAENSSLQSQQKNINEGIRTFDLDLKNAELFIKRNDDNLSVFALEKNGAAA